MVGQTVGSYRILEMIGEGGMGRVYVAEHTLIGKRAAIKVLLPQFTTNANIVNRFFNEAKSITLLKHPGVVDVYDFGHLPDGSAFIVMELLDGESLQRALERQGRLSSSFAVDLTRQIASTLAVAHAKGIVHRDLKPENIFLVPDAETRIGVRAKVLDFGIAKLAGEPMQGTKTRTGALMGTPSYMSPEQCRGAGQVDHRSDIYSLGCILYEMVSGRLPFTGEGVGDIISAHMLEAPPALPADVPEDLRAVISRAMTKAAAERHPSMTDFAQALERSDGSARTASQPVEVRAVRDPSARRPTAAQSTTLGGSVVEIPNVPSGPRPGIRVVGVSLAVLLAVGTGAYVRLVRSPPTHAPALATPPPPTVPAKVAAPAKVQLEIRSNPSGAEIFRMADGIRIGQTPFAYETAPSPGDAVFLLKRTGYADQRVFLSAEHSGRLDVELVRSKTKSSPRPATRRLEKPSVESKPPEPPPARPIKNGVIDPF